MRNMAVSAAVKDSESLMRGQQHSPSSSNVQIPTSPSQFEYEVFLSFRGEDTRNGFTGHLYKELERKGIKTFMDSENLKSGKSISPGLLKAIEESQIAVVILSANYATSTWCLDELAHIVKCKNSKRLEIFPVFYHVETSEVRKQQTGKFAGAFRYHEEAHKDDMEKVKKWREALTEVASISGWDVKGRSESDVVQDIARKILSILNSTRSSDWMDLIGMDARVEKMVRYLDLGSNDVRTIGIWGMEGIGKTSLANAVFDKIRNAVFDDIRSEFDCSAFIQVRVKFSEGDGIVPLQNDLCKQLLLDSNANIPNDFVGAQILRKRLLHKKVLVILDDVDQLKQIEYLAAEAWLGRGSRVVITTRDKHKLRAFGVLEDKTYEVEKLTDEEAMKLLCQKAFKSNSPPDEYFNLCKNFLKYAGGLPLALKVLGAHLCGRNVDQWSAAFARLDADPDQGEKLWMHDLLQKMGWHIVRRESPK